MASCLPRLAPTLRLAASLPLALLVWGALAQAGARAEIANATPAAKGAQVYCFMRGAGNTHEVSWTAAYALIKRQSASMFKTSPEHAAVMITEAVVQNPGNYPDCGKYLGSLFEKAATPPEPTPSTATPAPANPGPSRYAY